MKNVFVDSNVWIYAISDNDKEKRSRGIALLSRTDLTFFTSMQVINEVCFTLIRKFSASENFISEIIDSFYFRTQVLQPDRNSLFQASQLRRNYNLSFWDSQIVSAAIDGSCDTLITEDMQDGLNIEDRIKIANPFR